MIAIVFETHSTTEDNEAGRATGWLPGRLSPRGRAEAAELGRRRADDGITTVFCSDLRRAVETAEVAFGESGIPVLLDWRLRECDYGTRNGMPTAELHGHRGGPLGGRVSRRGELAAGDRPGRPVPRRSAVALEWPADRRHRPRCDPWGLDRFIHGAELADLAAADFDWRPGWAYEVPGARSQHESKKDLGTSN
jgi:2,3-bisphosphoglycerate-dependent phosphoglycerate mutase